MEARSIVKKFQENELQSVSREGYGRHGDAPYMVCDMHSMEFLDRLIESASPEGADIT